MTKRHKSLLYSPRIETHNTTPARVTPENLMSTPPPPKPPPNPPKSAPQPAFDALGAAYWDASDLASKDLLHGTQAAIGELITALDECQIADNTDAFIALTPKMKAVNDQLKEIEASIKQITRNIDTASTVLAAASKVLSLLPL